MSGTLRAPVTQLHGVGPAIAQRLSSIGVHKIYELLFHFPKRHEDYSRVSDIAASPLGEPTTICVYIKSIRKRQAWKRRRFSLTEATVQDDTGTLKIIWFNQPYIAEQLTKGDQIFLSGKIVEDKYGRHMNNPVFERYKSETLHTARIVPVYPTTYGITQKQWRYFIKQTLELLDTKADSLPDWIPPSVQDEYDIIPVGEALWKIHFPDNFSDVNTAKHRFGFEELLLVQLFILYTKSTLAKEIAQPIPTNEIALQSIVKNLPFTLTAAQKQAAWQIISDCSKQTPMNRLLEGDVGSGKTIVATLAMFNAAQAGFQSILMAPTEILATQHFQTISELLSGTDCRVGLWTSHQKDSRSNADIMIGTHALIQKQVTFTKVGLVVVDEQHRFGVKDRQLLKQHSGDPATVPHLLSMTATPIPRSLALTIYGDLELSIISDVPHGRKPITTHLVTNSADRKQMQATIREHIRNGEQVYMVAPRIEDIDEGDENITAVISVNELFTRMKKVFPEQAIAQLHGKMTSEAKKNIMEKFTAGNIDILVATTVIEVGVDVPNATVIVIEEAEWFGLAQLHQLRGRVGRSDKPSQCFVCTNQPSQRTKQRLDYFVQTRDGFQLAEYDLELRGPGDVYGRQQSGFLSYFKIAKLSDHALIAKSQAAAKSLSTNLKRYPTVQSRLDQFIKQVHLE